MNEVTQGRTTHQLLECNKAHQESENVIRRSVRQLEIIVPLQGIAITVLAVALIIHILTT